MPDPKVTYPSNTTFGTRINDLKAEKQLVAKKVYDEFLGMGTSAFIGDGSSTFYLGLELFDRQQQASVWTNNLAVAHEFPLRASGGANLSRVTVELAGGDVDRDLMMTSGLDAERFVEEVSRRAENVILSIRCLFSHEGPSGVEQNSLAIKRACVRQAAQSGAKIIFLTDHTKMSRGYLKSDGLVYRLEADWNDMVQRRNLYIVTTRHPKAGGQRTAVPNPHTDVEWYLHHAFVLQQRMKERFIEV